MPWRLKRQLILIVLGVGAMALGIVVFVLNRDTASDLLALVAFLGGVAIILNTFPTNGNGNGSHD
jgi:hypothetical protein